MRYFSTQRPLTPGAFPKPSDKGGYSYFGA